MHHLLKKKIPNHDHLSYEVIVKRLLETIEKQYEVIMFPYYAFIRVNY